MRKPKASHLAKKAATSPRMGRPKEPHLSKNTAKELRKLVKDAASHLGCHEYELVSDRNDDSVLWFRRAMEQTRPLSLAIARELCEALLISFTAKHKSPTLAVLLFAVMARSGQNLSWRQSEPSLLVFPGSSRLASDQITEGLVRHLGLGPNRSARARRYLRAYFGAFESINKSPQGERVLKQLEDMTPRGRAIFARNSARRKAESNATLKKVKARIGGRRATNPGR